MDKWYVLKLQTYAFKLIKIEYLSLLSYKKCRKFVFLTYLDIVALQIKTVI